MLFCSEKFLLFFTLVFVVYWAMPWRAARVYLLLAASFYFYASWNQWLALIIGVSTTIDYFLARGMDAAVNPRRRKLLLERQPDRQPGAALLFQVRQLLPALAGRGAARGRLRPPRCRC